MTAQATAMETKQRPWWLMLIEGIALFVIAAVLLWAPIKTRVNTYMLLVQLLGLYWVIQGIFNIVAMFMDHSGWGWKLFIGIVSIIAGGYILMYPIATGLVLPQIFVLMLGIWGLMEGIVLLIMAFRGGGWAAGILGVLAIVLRRHPDRELLRPGHGPDDDLGRGGLGFDRRHRDGRPGISPEESLTFVSLRLPGGSVRKLKISDRHRRSISVCRPRPINQHGSGALAGAV